MERTLLVVKPGSVSFIPTIVISLRNAGLWVAEADSMVLTEHEVRRLYPEKVDEAFFPDIVGYLTSGVSHVWVVEGENAVSIMLSIKGKGNGGGLRGKFARDRVRNILHTSESVEEAKREIGIFFNQEVRGGRREGR